MSDPTSDWIEWTGGECPVSVGRRVQYRSQSGFESGVYVVPDWEVRSTAWAHGAYPDRSTDIIAYRVVPA